MKMSGRKFGFAFLLFAVMSAVEKKSGKKIPVTADFNFFNITSHPAVAGITLHSLRKEAVFYGSSVQIGLSPAGRADRSKVRESFSIRLLPGLTPHDRQYPLFQKRYLYQPVLG